MKLQSVLEKQGQKYEFASRSLKMQMIWVDFKKKKNLIVLRLVVVD